MARVATVLLAGLLLLNGCDGAARPVAQGASPTASPTTSPTANPIATARPTPKPKPRATAVKRSPAPKPKPRRTTKKVPVVAPRPTCPQVPALGPATQVVLVSSAGSSATVRACQRQGSTWVLALGPMYGHVGSSGVALAGAKREGDRRTPSGSYPLGRGFGVLSDPGVAFSWRRVGSNDVWVDDSGSSLYNTWQQKPANGRWQSAESLDKPGAYDYAQVIDYNTARVPGRGSAIFFHVDHGSPTVGCVSVPRADLLALFRWERPGAVIVIR